MADDLRDEYQFDYRHAKPNRFAAVIQKEGGVKRAGRPDPGDEEAADETPSGGLSPADIVGEVRAVLATAHRGKGDHPNYLTAFQILDRLPAVTRERLIRERGAGGAGTGVFAAPSVVSRAARMAGAEVAYLDSVGLSVQVAGQAVTPSYEVCAVYRLPAAEPANP